MNQDDRWMINDGLLWLSAPEVKLKTSGGADTSPLWTDRQEFSVFQGKLHCPPTPTPPHTHTHTNTKLTLLPALLCKPVQTGCDATCETTEEQAQIIITAFPDHWWEPQRSLQGHISPCNVFN